MNSGGKTSFSPTPLSWKMSAHFTSGCSFTHLPMVSSAFANRRGRVTSGNMLTVMPCFASSTPVGPLPPGHTWRMPARFSSGATASTESVPTWLRRNHHTPKGDSAPAFRVSGGRMAKRVGTSQISSAFERRRIAASNHPSFG